MPKFADYTISGRSGTKYTFGLYPFPNTWKALGAVYIITKRVEKPTGGGSHTHIYAGETGDLSTRHERHHRKPCFDKHGANCIGVLLEEGEQRRLDIETDIRNNGDAWPCNDQ